ncbi:MAG: hypothetical protein PVH84_15030, partial [Candidatus Aminicenantes bacterium]|jgi:NADH-quinone oxidoreductase subunit M
MFQRVMHGPITNDRVNNFKDLNKRELAYLLPIVVMMFWMGVYPQPFLRKMDASVEKLLDQINQKKTLFTEVQKENKLLWDIKALESKSEDHIDKEEEAIQ